MVGVVMPIESSVASSMRTSSTAAIFLFQECRVLAPKAMAMDSLELPNGCKNLWNRQVTPAFAGAVAVAQQ